MCDPGLERVFSWKEVQGIQLENGFMLALGTWPYFCGCQGLPLPRGGLRVKQPSLAACAGAGW